MRRIPPLLATALIPALPAPAGQAAVRGADAIVTPAQAPAGHAATDRSPHAAADRAAEASGRRTLSTAFVRLGPDGRLTVELRDGRMLHLRDVTLGARAFCGMAVANGASGGMSGKRQCSGYAAVATERADDAPPGALPIPAGPGPVATERPPGDAR